MRKKVNGNLIKERRYMKKLLFALGLLSMSVTSCVQEMVNPQEEQDVRVYPEFFVEEVEPYDTGVKTSLTEDRRLVWSAGDQLAIFQGSSIADKYQVKDSADGQMNASFSIVCEQAGEDDDFFAGVEVKFDTNVALYPYQSGLTCVPVYGAPVDEGEDSVVSYRITDVVFPSVQSYVANSFAEESYMMVSVTSDKSYHNLKFKNVCGAMKLQLKGTAKVRTIELMGNADEPLAGSAVITAYSDGTVPAVSMLSTATKTVTLDCGEGVQLSEDTPTVFMISLPPTAFANGFTATLTAADGSTGQLSTTKANPVNRSKIKSMPACRVAFTAAEPEPEPEPEDYDENRYIVYNGTGRDNNTVISGDSYWDIQPFLYSRVSSINEIEMKFQMGPSSASPYDSERRWLFSSERPFVNNGARLTSEGLVLRYNNSGEDVITNEKIITWDEMDVSMTDKIVLNISVSAKKITINDKEISVPELETFTDIEYLFSSYYYVNDDGYAKVYETAPIGSKLYYAKIWNTSGSLLYHGYASEGEVSEGNIQPAWKSKYNETTHLEFPNTNYKSFWVDSYTTSWPAFGEGVDNGETSSEASCLSETGTANSYIVSSAGAYQFTPTKGNSSESVGEIASADVLWESYGTSSAPSKGSLVTYAKYEDGNIFFSTPDSFREGNAVIAAKDASGTILWSWHIWMTDQPQEQIYYNNAGTMMDRNLGATSATPGEVGALGLLYQWGRKDPFLGSSSINSSNNLASSSITWPSAVSTNATYGTVEYVTANPTVFVSSSETTNYDWHYSTRNDELWASDKTIYDPCPAGWRVPDGGRSSVWAIAFDSPEDISNHPFDDSSKGMNFTGELGGAATIWYPVVGYRNTTYNGSLSDVGRYASYLTVTPLGSMVRPFDMNFNGGLVPSFDGVRRGNGYPVRCFKEGVMSSDPVEPEAVNLSDEGTANSYIVSESGAYKFSAVKGNGSESVGAVASAEVLWETFGTDVTPSVGDLVKSVSYKDGEITFQTADTFKEGNAVIAAKDASGTILWSWHIWLTDEPQGQVYYNNAGTMMDRNLGATSATPGDVGALGLLYQWGRKDPFLGSSSISSNVIPKSTITWPSAVSSASSIGTIAYATANPTTFIARNTSNYDWYYTGDSSTDNTRWSTSDKTKSIYDPCPSGWRIPDGGGNGVWSTALGSSSSFTESSLYDSTNKGRNFSGKFGSSSSIWYPASGYRYSGAGSLSNVGYYGHYWSASPYNRSAYYLYFIDSGYVYPSDYNSRAYGRSIRCLQESK